MLALVAVLFAFTVEFLEEQGGRLGDYKLSCLLLLAELELSLQVYIDVFFPTFLLSLSAFCLLAFNACGVKPHWSYLLEKGPRGGGGGHWDAEHD